MAGLTQADLDEFGCENCAAADPAHKHEHDELYFHPRCHPGTGTWTRYSVGTGALTIVCRTCSEPVATIEVARGGGPALVPDPEREWTADDVRSLIANPIYGGIYPYPALVPREQWIVAAANQIKQDGAEAFLTRMTDELDAAMRTAFGDES